MLPASVVRTNYSEKSKFLALSVCAPNYEHHFPAPQFFQTLPELVTPLKGHSSPRSCPPTLSAPSGRFDYGLDKTVEAT